MGRKKYKVLEAEEGTGYSRDLLEKKSGATPNERVALFFQRWLYWRNHRGTSPPFAVPFSTWWTFTSRH